MPLYVATNDNIISAATIGTNQLWPGGSTGLNLSGSTPALKGKIAIWDGGRFWEPTRNWWAGLSK